MQYLTPEDWQEFSKEHPGASKWLTARNLEREREYLERLIEIDDKHDRGLPPMRRAWILERLQGLKRWD